MNKIITVPLNKLMRDPNNVRKIYTPSGIFELAASIQADGLIQDPVVRKSDKKGTFLVTAGGRRLAALLTLVDAGNLAADTPIQCKLLESDNAQAISLADNIMREAMSPAEELTAFSALIDNGLTVASIAQRFGTTETTVRKRLALARVSPVLMQLFAEERLDLSQLAAFTITDDHAEQERVWNSLSEYCRTARNIRHALTGEGIAATDKRVRFIGGLDAFETAGGSVKRDLFIEDEGGFALDIALLEKLAMEGLEKQADEVRSEGWLWVDVLTDMPYELYASYGRRYPQYGELNAQDQDELDALSAEHDSLAELLDAGDEDEETTKRYGQVSERIEELTEKRQAYTPEAYEIGGAVVTLNHQGGIRIERGFVHPDYAAQEKSNKSTSDNETAIADTTGTQHSQALLEDLTAQKSAALRASLANNPAMALVAVVHSLLLPVAYTYSRTQSALQISLHNENLAGFMNDADACKGLIELTNLCSYFGAQLPEKPAELFGWLLDKTQDELLSLLAFAASQSLNVVEKKHTGRHNAFAQGNELGRALDINMSDWFTTTADNYLSRINRNGIEAAVNEALGEQKALAVKAASKKTDAVKMAESLLDNTGWIPAPLRFTPAVATTLQNDTEIDVDTDDEADESDYPFPEAAE